MVLHWGGTQTSPPQRDSTSGQKALEHAAPSCTLSSCGVPSAALTTRSPSIPHSDQRPCPTEQPHRPALPPSPRSASPGQGAPQTREEAGLGRGGGRRPGRPRQPPRSQQAASKASAPQAPVLSPASIYPWAAFGGALQKPWGHRLRRKTSGHPGHSSVGGSASRSPRRPPRLPARFRVLPLRRMRECGA